jgi:tol-pal system protein YbgF
MYEMSGLGDIRGRNGAVVGQSDVRTSRPIRLVAVLPLICGLGLPTLGGCVAQQADLKQTERELQRKIKQSTEELAQTRARQSQEIVSLREQDIPALRGDLDKAVHKAQTLEVRQDDLASKLSAQEAKIDRRLTDSEKRSSEDNKRLGWVEKQLVDQDSMLKGDRERHKAEMAAATARLDQLATHLEATQKSILDAMQKTTNALAQKVDGRLEEQQKAIHAAEVKQQNLAQVESQGKVLNDQVGKFNQALVDFKQALNSLGERVLQQDQAVKQLQASIEQDNAALAKRADALAAKIEADNKITAEHLNAVNRSVASVQKVLHDAGGSLASRGDEQERRIEEMGRHITQVQSQIQTLDKNLENQHAFLKQVEQHLAAQRDSASQMQAQIASLDKNLENQHAFLKQVEQHLATQRATTVQRTEPAPTVADVAPLPQAQAAPAPESLPSAPAHASSAVAHAEARSVSTGDRDAYERTLNRFKEGDLDGARQGFAEFLTQHPHSELAPNARFWLGETYYGKKDYTRAIDAYDQVQLNHPASEKVPAALLKKGYAYLALKDRKKAASALKQVIDLYPKTPEANKAVDKLNQLKELH